MPLDRTWYNTLVDDDGSGLTGSVWDKADVNSLMTAIDAHPVCLATTSAQQTITPGVWTSVNFQGAPENSPPMWTPANAHIVTVPRPGHYYVNGCVYWSPGAAGVRSLRILYQGADVLLPEAKVIPASGVDYFASWLTGCVNIPNAGDQLVLQAWQNSGGNLLMGAFGAMSRSHFNVVYLF
jgi:hypothetical protein